MNIQRANISNPNIKALPAPPKNEAAEQTSTNESHSSETESYSVSRSDDDFTWGDLGKGLIGSAVGATVIGAGGAVAGVMKTPKITYEAVKGVWKSEKLGPVLKTTITPVVIAAGLAAPVFTAVGGALYGLFTGFSEAAEEGVGAAGKESVDVVKKMHGDYTKELVEGIREAASEKPESEDDIYEIKVIEGVKGLAASTTSAAVGAVGIGATTALHLPGGFLRASSEIWKSDAALPLKVGGQTLAGAAAVLAVPLGVVGGALYGLGNGAYKGYTEGFVAGNKETLKGIGDYHEMAKEAIYD